MLTEIECMNHLLMVEPSKVMKLNRSNFTEIEVEIAFSQKHSWNNQHLLKASSVPIYNKFYSDLNDNRQCWSNWLP